MAIKQNSTPIIYIDKIVDSTTKLGKTGLTSANITIYYSKNGLNSTRMLTPIITELDPVYFPGVYRLTLTNTQTNTNGFLEISASATGCDTKTEIHEVVQNIESDTKILLDALRTDYTSSLASHIATLQSITVADIWSYANRSLSTFGTLVTDTKNAVWSATDRQLTSFGILISDLWAYAMPNTPTVGSVIEWIKTNLDATISSRSTLTAQNVWTYVDRQMTSFGSLISQFWTWATRTLTVAPSTAGIGAYTLSVSITQSSLPSSSHLVRCYNADKTYMYETLTDVNGECSFNLNGGTYILQVQKSNTWSQEKAIIIVDANISEVFTVTSSATSGYSTYKITNSTKNYSWNVNEESYFVCLVENLQKDTFVITSATYSYVKENSSDIATIGNCTPEDDEIFFVFAPVDSGYYIVTVEIIIGIQKLKENFRINVS